MAAGLPVRMLRTVLIALLLVGAVTVLAPTASANDLVNKTCNSDLAEQYAFSCRAGRVVDCIERFIGSNGLYC